MRQPTLPLQSLFLLFVMSIFLAFVLLQTDDHLLTQNLRQFWYPDKIVVTDIDWRDDGNTLAVQSITQIYLHDMTNPDAPPRLQGGGNLPIGRMSPDGRVIITLTNIGLEFLDAETGVPIREPIEYCGWGVNPIWTHIVIHCHGNWVSLHPIFESENDPGSPINNLNPFGAGGGIVIDAFSSDGSIFVATIEEQLRFFCLSNEDYSSFGCINPIERNYTRDIETELVFSPDNRYLVAHQFVYNDEETQINIWNLDTGEMLFETIVPIFIHHLIFSPNGDYIVAEGYTFGATQILVWQMQDILNGNTEPAMLTNLESVPQPSWYNAFAFSPDSTRLALATKVNQLFIWDTSGTPNTWSSPLIISSYQSGDHRSTRHPFAFHPQSTYLAYADLDGSVVVINMSDLDD